MKKLKNLMKKLLYSRKKEVEDIKDERVVPVSRWLCKAKDNNKTYILSIFYDTHSFMYRIVDMNKLEIHGDYLSKENALEHIYQMSSEVIGIRVHNCVNYESIS